jgi:hypothetical protein
MIVSYFVIIIFFSLSIHVLLKKVRNGMEQDQEQNSGSQLVRPGSILFFRMNNCVQAVLIQSGCYCPVHIAHVEMFEVSSAIPPGRALLCFAFSNFVKVVREELRQRGVNVIGGFLCPANDKYVKHKARQRCYVIVGVLDISASWQFKYW